jgi:hypothetical protein
MNYHLRVPRARQVPFRFDPRSPKQLAASQVFLQPGPEEGLIQDDRAALRPAQMVENKLSGVLKGAFVLVSQLRLMDLIRRGSGS